MSEEIDKKIIDETLEELGFEEHVSSLSEEKPKKHREFWIVDNPNTAIPNAIRTKINFFDDEKKYVVHVIEKSAYDKAVEALKNIERDHPKTFLDVGDTLKDLGEKE